MWGEEGGRRNDSINGDGLVSSLIVMWGWVVSDIKENTNSYNFSLINLVD